MAGETPNAHNVQRARAAAARKANAAFNANPNADKYYKSPDRSALQPQIFGGDGRGRHGQAPQPIPTPKLRESDRRADKYYENPKPGKQPVPGQRATGAGAAPAAPRRRTRQLPNGTIGIESSGEINGLVVQIIDTLNRGEDLTIVVPKGDAPLLKRVRTAMEMLVTRERLTEEEFDRIKFGYDQDEAPKPSVRSVLEKLGPPMPRGEVNMNAEEELDALLDPTAVLAGDVDLEALDRQVDAAAVAPIEDTVEDDDLPNLPDIEAPPIQEPAAEADEDSDYNALPNVEAPAETITPTSETIEPAAETPAIETPPEQPQQRRRPGKRSGRGSN